MTVSFAEYLKIEKNYFYGNSINWVNSNKSKNFFQGLFLMEHLKVQDQTTFKYVICVYIFNAKQKKLK